MTAPGILIAGTSSDAGKSLLVAGLCRILRNRGVDVVPFKAQNMSNNSMVCPDGSEIGRAQYLQALAARVPPTSAMNPVLLKPGTDRRSHIVLRGEPAGVLDAGQYATGRTQLRDAAWAAYAELAAKHELVLCEGAGSPAEINLRAGDYVNFGLAQRFNLPVVVVGDIDRGGILAALYGTWALAAPPDRALIRGFIINKFRGDQSVLDPGLVEISRRTGIPFFGVVPWLPDVWLDGEDALAFAKWPQLPGVGAALKVAVIRLPRLSNATDLDALAAEPGVEVQVTANPVAVAAADLVVLPGTRSTLSDLAWLRERGLAAALVDRAAAGKPILGICGGYQMLGGVIVDEIEGRPQTASGLGLLPTRTDFQPAKILATPVGVWRGLTVNGYEIHHGVVTAVDPAPQPASPPAATPPAPPVDPTAPTPPTPPGPEPFLDGYRVGQTYGTIWHGILENDGFRRAWLTEIARAAQVDWRPDPSALNFNERREIMLDRLAEALTSCIDIDALLATTKGL